jgi:hsp70-interacting protein
MADPSQQQSLNELLRWGIENSASTQNGTTTQAPSAESTSSRGLNPEILAQLLGGPSDADRMKEAMSAIVAPLDQVDIENKKTAWDNFEQLIENLDNANNMEPLGLWKPLVQQLSSSEAEMRKWAAWCISTAVQNNIKSQEKLLSEGGVPLLGKLATEDENRDVRKKAVSALSSAVRNFQPALDELEQALPQDVWRRKGLDAGDMDSVNEVIEKLREQAAR